MFLDWKNQYCENDYTTPWQSTDSMQCLSNYTELEQKIFNLFGDTKDPA